MEPVCAEIVPGNSIDASSYPSFIRNNNIRKGIIIADKGFPPAAIKDGRFLYSFKDTKQASAEESSYLARAEEKHDFDPENYAKRKETFGVIVFESDQDLPPETVYKCYDDRWLLELVFKHYKSDECLDRTNVQGDFSLIGSEFIDFIATVATCRIIRKARDAGLLNEMLYGELMEDLSSAWRMTGAPQPPTSNDSYWVHTLKYVFEELEALELSEPAPKPASKKRGRPKKKADENKPKRPRGRPRKNSLPAEL